MLISFWLCTQGNISSFNLFVGLTHPSEPTLDLPQYVNAFSVSFYFQKKHLCGRRHHEKLTEWSLELFPTSSPIRQREIDLLDDSKYQEFEEDNEDGMVE